VPLEHAKVAVPAVLAAFAAALFASPARAGLLAHESFETEALGAFDGTADQTWTLGPVSETIEDKDLSYSGGDVDVSSGDRALKISGGGGGNYFNKVANFDLPSAQTGTVYFSCLAQVTTNCFLSPWFGTSATGTHEGSGMFFMDARSGGDVVSGAMTPVGITGYDKTGDLANAKPAPIFVVIKVFKSGAGNYDRLQVEVDPTTSGTEPATSSLDRFGLRYGNNAAGWVDEIRIGTTWADVVTLVPSVTADPAALFGDLTSLGGNPGPQVETVTISNDSSGAVDLGTLSITGDDSGLYEVTDGPTQDPIPAGGTADIEVTFTPPAQGGIFQASLEIPTDHPQVPAVVVELDALVSLTLPVHESFETEAAGAFDGAADLDWTLGDATETIVDDKDLSYSGGDLTVDSGERALRISNLAAYTSPVVSFNIASQSGPVYFSFLGQIANEAFFQPWVGYSAAGGAEPHFGSGQVYMDGRAVGGGDVIKGTLLAASGPPVNTGDLGNAEPAPIFVVAKLFKSGAGNYDRMQVLVNPTSATEPGTWDGDITNDLGVASLDLFGIRYGNNAAGWIDEIRVGTSWADVVPVPPDLQLAVETSGSNLVFTWASWAGKQYDLLSATGLDTPPATPWPVYTDTASTTHGDIPASGTGINTLTVPRDPADPRRFFALREEDLLDEGFESASLPDGWDATDNGNGTAWEFGEPDSSTGAPTGPDGGFESTNCAGTNLLDTYTASASASLKTRAIAIPAGGATLTFQQWIDTETTADDSGAINVLDADDNDAFLAAIDTGINGIGQWEAKNYSLGGYAGQNIKLEFVFESDATEHWAGWYLDDVLVTGD